MSNSTKKIVDDLKKLLDSNIDPSMFPYAKGNSIRIKNYVIRETKHGYTVWDIKEEKIVASLFCKTSAIAFVKAKIKNRNIPKVIHLDKLVMKHYNDAVFHKYTARVTKDDMRREVAETRYQISADLTQDVKQQLESYIY